MRTHGVFLRLEGRRCVVIGDDETAGAKAAACLGAGASVTIVGPRLPEALRELGAGAAVRHLRRDYRYGDLEGAFLAYASLRDPSLVRRVREEASTRGVLLNVVDVPDACDFFAGAVIERGPVEVLIGTGGTAPAVAGLVRRRIDGTLGPEVGALAVVLGALRTRLVAHPERAEVLRRLAQSRLLDHLRSGAIGDAERLIHEVTGVRCSLETLGVAPGAP
jgi:siroheme synthase-like protein